MAVTNSKHLYSVVVPNEYGDYILQNPEKGKLRLDELDQVPTIAAILPYAAKKYGNNRLFGIRPVMERETFTDKAGRIRDKVTLGEYQWSSYTEILERVENFSSGLRLTGLKSKEFLSIFMNSCPEWQIASMAALAQSSPVVTIYATLGEEAMLYGMNQTNTTHIITEASLLGQLQRVVAQGANIKTIIYTGEADPTVLDRFPKHVSVLKYLDVESSGAANPSQPEKVPEPDDLAVIMYTSGSTGMPKGVQLTHTNILHSMHSMATCIPKLVANEDSYISFLPLAHILAFLCDLFFIFNGCMVGYGTPSTLTDSSPRIKPGTKGDITALCPTYLACVPTILDRIYQGIHAKINNAPYHIQAIFWAGYAVKAAAWSSDTDTWLGYAASMGAAFVDQLIFNKLKAVLGGKMKAVLAGGAPLSASSQEFMTIVFGFPTVQGYGLTETCGMGAICDFSSRGDFGVVGGPEECDDIKIVDWDEGGYRVADKDDPTIGCARGEICVSGSSVSSGYYKMPEKTAESFIKGKDGKLWFYTGDIAKVLPNGALQIIDRKKDLVKLQQGEYVSLGKIESVLSTVANVEQICVHVDPFQSYCIALIVPLKASKLVALKAAGINVNRPWEDVCNDPAVKKIMLDGVQAIGKSAKLASFELPAKVVLLAEPWLPESGLVTASMKIQRPKIYKAFEKQIAAAYE